MTKKILIVGFITFLVVVVLLLIATINLKLSHTIPILNIVLRDNQFNFMLWRYSVLALLFLFWKQVINLLSKTCRWNEEWMQQIKVQRIKVFLFIFVFEILAVHNCIGHLINYFAS